MTNRRKFVKQGALWLAASALSPRYGFPSIVRAGRRLEKPLGAVYINWGHPLAQGLSFLVPFNEGGGINGDAGKNELYEAVGGIKIETDSPANCSWVDGVGGKAIRFSNVAAHIPLNGSGKDSLMPLDRLTVLFIRRFTDGTQRNHTDFGFGVAAADTGHVGAICPNSTGLWVWRAGTLGGADSELLIPAIGKSQTIEYLAFVTGGRGMSIWRNGQLLGSQVEHENRTSNPSEVYYINQGLQSTANNGDLQEVYFFAVYHEEWTPDQISWWMQEPYAMLTPQSPLIRYFGAGGAGSRRTVIMQ